MLFDEYDAAQVESFIADSSKAGKDLAEIQGIIEARMKNTKFPDIKYLQPDDLRFGTQSDVAYYRAKRLACDTLVEIGAGVGMQTIAFAKNCKRVIAVERDKRKMIYCRQNCDAASLTNVEFIEGDAMALAGTLPKAYVIFLDPQRPAQEEMRDLHVNFSPPIHDFINKYSERTTAIAIELPPHIHSIDVEGEQEYISLNGELRRLTLYLGPLAKAERSAVALPAKARIEGAPAAPAATGKLCRHLYEVDEAVVNAQLVPLLLGEKGHVFSTQKNVLATSVTRVDSPFFRNSFEVVAFCPPEYEQIMAALQEARAKNVVLRGAIDPPKYWEQRAKYQKGLTGTETVHLFLLPEMAIVAKKFATTVKRV